MTPRELIKHLQGYPQDAVIAYDIWQVDDVKHQAPHLTEEQCEDVINGMEHRKDASFGLNWDIMDSHIWEVENADTI